MEDPIPSSSSAEEDKGAHYRNEYLGVPFDVYRALRIFKIADPTAQHMFKKLARGTRKGHSVNQLVDELQCCLDRWRQLNAEDEFPLMSVEDIQTTRKVKFNPNRPHDD